MSDVVKTGIKNKIKYLYNMLNALKICAFKLRGLSPHANYTDRAAAAGRQS